MAVVTIVFLGIAGMTGCASSEKLLIQKNWEMKLPDGGTEDSYAEFAEKYLRMDLSNMPKGIYIVKAGDAIRKLAVQ